MKDYIALSDRIGAKKYSMVLTVLNKNTDLDMTYENGTFFITAIEQNSYDIASTLLDYFQRNQLDKHEPYSLEYLLLKKRMYDIIEVAIEDVELSEEMQKVLVPYLPQEEADYQLDLNDSLIVSETNDIHDLKLIGDTQNDHHPISHEVL